MKSIITKIKILYCYLQTRIVKLLRLFNIRLSTKPIPKGMYCYVYDDERNEKEKPTLATGYYIKPCKYYRSFPDHNIHACLYIGCFNDSILLFDQCKECGVNDYNPNDYADDFDDSEWQKEYDENINRIKS